jgi:hypothetical protein
MKALGKCIEHHFHKVTANELLLSNGREFQHSAIPLLSPPDQIGFQVYNCSKCLLLGIYASYKEYYYTFDDITQQSTMTNEYTGGGSGAWLWCGGGGGGSGDIKVVEKWYKRILTNI